MEKRTGLEFMLKAYRGRHISEEYVGEIGRALDRSSAIVERAVLYGEPPVGVEVSLRYPADSASQVVVDFAAWHEKWLTERGFGPCPEIRFVSLGDGEIRAELVFGVA